MSFARAVEGMRSKQESNAVVKLKTCPMAMGAVVG
jgi:hypothetical protein